uniref:GLUG motif-containing protein n=1 Tax=Alistipes sp. TaxID=1872444 RepID=UPI004055F572
MKNIYYYLILALSAAMLAIGCTEDLTTDESVGLVNGSDKEFMTVTAALEFDAPAEGEKSRATLVDDGNGKVVWSEGDTIGAVSSDGTITECAAVSIDGSSAMFSVPTDTKYAIYPYNASQSFNVDTKKLSHSLVSTVTLDGSKRVFDDEQNTMVAHLSGDTLPFKHLCGYIEVKLTGSQVVKHIALRSNTKSWDALSGLGTLDISNPDEPKITMGKTSTSTFNWVYAACEDVQLSDEATSFYFIVPPRTYENLTICVQTDKGSYSITSKNAITVNRAKIRPLAAINVDKLAHTTVTDLSAKEVANCYVVSQSNDVGYFSFPARKINSTATLSGAAYAHLVWSEHKELVTNVNYDASTGKVSFKYGGSNLEGNALVAVMDASHNVLWSWHIWCTDTPQLLTLRKIGDASQMYGILDRNLGATYTPATAAEAAAMSDADASAAIGLQYQYGRPTPSPRQISIKDAASESPAFSNSNYDVMYGFNAKVQKFTLSNTAYTQSEALSYPNTHFIVYYTSENGTTITTSTTTSYYTWHKSPYNPYSSGINLWYSKNANNVDKKADNDPCPAGYVVEEGLAAKNYMTSSPYKRVSYGSEENQSYGHYYSCPITGGVVYIPASGYRNNLGQLCSTGKYFNQWLVPTSEDLGNLSVYRFYGANNKETFTPTSAEYRMLGYGFNVRCRVKDRTPLQSGITISAEFEGEGTAASPFLIKQPIDLVKLAGLCNGSFVSTNDVDYKSAHYAMANDINMSGAPITPITPFSGVFDGGNYTLSNLTVMPNGGTPTGLFGKVENATIKNVKITNGDVSVTSTTQLYTGGIAGYALNSTIDNCSFAGAIKSAAKASLTVDSGSRTNCAVLGGIVGFAKNSTISNSTFSGAGVASAGQFVGGIAGIAEGGEVSKCTTVKDSNLYCEMNHIGGITALASFDVKISECVSEAIVVCRYFYVGGLVGYMQSGTIDKCLVSSNANIHGGYNNEKEDGWVGVGGIVGIADTEKAKGTVIAVKNSACYANVKGNVYIGGIIGNIQARVASIPVTFSNNLFVGSLALNYYNSNKYGCAGGVIGCCNPSGKYDVSFTDCVALVNGMTVNSGATLAGYGGVAGFSSSKTSFTRCYSNFDSGIIVTQEGKKMSEYTSIKQYGNMYGVAYPSTSLTDCYYFTGNIGASHSTGGPATTNVEPLSLTDMTNGTLLGKLNAAGGSWVTGVDNYPIPSTVPTNTTTVSLERKTRVSIIGDSISTFSGWIPSGFSAYYPYGDVTSGTYTYWYKLIYNYMSNGVFEKNISWSGSCATRMPNDTSGNDRWEICFVERFIDYGLGNPDVILMHGGTNDVKTSRPISLFPGYPANNASNYDKDACPTDEELKQVFDIADAATTYTEAQALNDTTFVEAYVKLLMMMHHRYPSAKVVMIIGDWIPQGARKAILKIAAHYQTKYEYRCADLQEISPEANPTIPKCSGSHPTKEGMEMMANFIYQKVGDYID